MLDPGEELLWTGKPGQGIRFHAVDLIFIPWSIVWTSFAFFWEYSVVALWAWPSLIFGIFGLPFVAVGAHITIGRFYVDAHRRKSIDYAITNRRVLIRSRFPKFKEQVVVMHPSLVAQLQVRKDGSGTITFGSNDDWYTHRGRRLPGFFTPCKLEHIADVKRIHALIKSVANLEHKKVRVKTTL